MSNKRCPKCETVRPYSDYHKCKSRKDGIQGVCKLCTPKRDKSWYEKHKQKRINSSKKWYKSNTEKVRGYGLKKYNLTVEQYDLMAKSQNDVCSICKLPEQNKKLAVDHCHKTNKVRALLCEACNRGLGHFKDNPELLIKAASYLSSF